MPWKVAFQCISEAFPVIKKTQDDCKPAILIFSVMKNRSIPRKSNILTTHQPKGLEGSDSQAKMWRHSTPSSASALKGPTPPPQSVATINLRWFSPVGKKWMSMGKGSGEVLGRSHPWRFASIFFVSFKGLRENKIEWSMGEGSFPFLGGRLPTVRGGPPARNVTKWLPIWQHNTSVMCN